MANLVIRNATLHDGSGSSPLDHAVLVCEDGRVAYAGPERGAPPAPAGAELLDAGGAHLLPGLIDAHVHLCLSGGADFMAEATCAEEEAVERGIANARALLAAGITAVRDLGGVENASLRIASLRSRSEIPGPRILTAGRVLTVRGGHAHVIGIEADTPAELEAAVKSLHRSGATVIKIVVTGGVLTKGVDAQSATYPEPAIRAAASAAHARGLRIAAHALGREGIESAIRAGVDSIEHGCYLSDFAVEALRSGPHWLVPTLSAPTRVLEAGDKVPAYARAKSEEVSAAHHASLARAAAAGARIAAGTDAGTPFNPHGDLASELALYARNGMTPDRILVAATSEAAGLLGLGDAGFLRPGYVADAVVLGGDPLESVDAYRAVRVVVQAGRVVST